MCTPTGAQILETSWDCKTDLSLYGHPTETVPGSYIEERKKKSSYTWHVDTVC